MSNTYFAIRKGTQIDEFDYTVWNARFTQSFQVFDDIFRLNSNTYSRIKGVSC